MSLFSFVLERSSFEHIIGDSDRASTAEKVTAAAIVTASSANTRPMLSFKNATGANTETSTTVVAITANATWRVPLNDASSGVSPILYAPVRVLEHDDRVVDHETDRQREREQRHEIDRKAERREHRERRD